MVDHIGRKVWTLLTLLVVSLFALWALGFRMGLDLQGGTRLVYSVDIDKALEDGSITKEQHQDPDALMAELIRIWSNRIDPNGVKGVVIREEGTNRVVIELPGSASASRTSYSLPLGAALGLDDSVLSLEKDPTMNAIALKKLFEGFPATGGLVEINGERIRYGKRVGNELRELERNAGGTERGTHAVGDAIVLKAADPWRQLIENTGSMAFMIEATDEDLTDNTNPALSTDLITEREKVEAWRTANPKVSIKDYNSELGQEKGPAKDLRWYPQKADTEESSDRLQPLILEDNLKWRFDGTDFPTFFQSQDDLGLPAVGFASVPERQNDFGEFTKQHKGERMAIVINDEIVTFPNINGRLQGAGVIEGGPGGFTSEEVTGLVKILRSGSLRVRPDFEAQETVGATLGSDYVKRGFYSAAIGLLFVLIFMLVYYRKLGLLAGVSLVFNMVILLGAMAFIQATLTLPGVAGIILTVGMAVDANILIYERIREEQLRGRKPIQSAKDGFKNATSTIVDANVTTLIVGLILYKFGTGPVKGFATTLCIGIITSMISALMLTRLLVHFALERGVESWSMMRLVTETKINFIKKARMVVPVSVLFIVAGLGLFISEDDIKKLGIDFTGGTTATIRTEAPQPTETVRALFDPSKNDKITGTSTLTSSVVVRPILNSGSADVGYTAFRIESKAPEEDQTSIRQDILDFLSTILQKGPVDVTVEGTVASGRLYFDTGHDTAELAAALAGQCNITDPTVTLVEGTDNIYDFTGNVVADKAIGIVQSDILGGLEGRKDTGGTLLSLSGPISELSSVGAQVVEELRDNAVLAILLSLFAAVMYIRVRFTEYSYGFAAVLALVHDVSLTLGALGVMIWTGWVRAEIDLPMIAAFLTIIGYSLNDTIVVFDRVRENLPRMKGDLTTVVNRSINQTLSRTLLTSVTTLISVTLLFAFNVGTGNVIEAFSFAMIVGVLVGTYSSMFIASPALVWLETRRLKNLPGSDEGEETEASKKQITA